MGLLFLILKLIGVLLAVILLIVAAVLIVPVRYRICIKAWDQIAVTGGISWLCYLFRLKIQYGEGKTVFHLRILGIPIAMGEEKKHKKEKKRRKRKSRKKDGKEAQPQESASGLEASFEHENVSGQCEEDALPLQETLSKQEESQSNKKKRHSSGKKQKKKKKQVRQRISDGTAGIASGREKLQNIKNMIFEETNKNALIHAFWELRVLMRHYLPGKAVGELVFGAGDPARTGQVLGLLSCLPTWARYQVSITPDFEAESIYAKGEVDMKGHIRCWHFLWSAFRLFKDKDMKKLIRKFRT